MAIIMKKTLQHHIGILLITVLPLTLPVSSLRSQDYVRPDFRVSDSTGYDYNAPSLSVSLAGDMAVAWETTGDGGIWLKTVTSLGTVLREQKRVRSPFYHEGTRVAHSDSGNFMVIFGGNAASWSVYGQAYGKNGDELGDTLNITRSTGEMIEVYRASLSADDSNRFGAMLPGWDSLIVEKVSGMGAFTGDHVVLKPDMVNAHYLTGVMTRSGYYIMIWHDFTSGNIYGLRYTPEGVPAGTSFQVSQREQHSFLREMALASDTAGNFAVVWTEATDSMMFIFSRHYDAETLNPGSATMIAGEKFTIIGRPSVDMDLDGNYVVAWSDKRSGDTSFIYIQQMDGNGEKIGDNYRATSVNNNIPAGSSSSPNQVEPCIRILRDTIYLAWTNFNADVGFRQEIYANIQKWRVPATGIDRTMVPGNGISIYPNPSPGIFSLAVEPANPGRLELKVYNTRGAMVWQELKIWNGSERRMDLSALPEGVYYLDITGDSFHSTKAIVIVK